jgi:hypothetical protein
MWVITRLPLQRSDVSFRRVRTSLRCSRVSYQRVFRAPDAARCSSPWRGASAAQPRRLLPPVRPGVGTDYATAGADHAGAERWHCHVIGPRVRAQDHPVVAQPAAHVERTHAVGAHVAEGHGRSRQPPWSLSTKAAAVADIVGPPLLTPEQTSPIHPLFGCSGLLCWGGYWNTTSPNIVMDE